MKTGLSLLGVVFMLLPLLTFPGVYAQETSYLQMKSDFQTLPSSAREMTGPLFWLHGDESRERLEFTVDKVAEGGNGMLCTESRPHCDWLGETWYRDVEIVLNQAKKHDMKVIILQPYCGGTRPPIIWLGHQ